MTVTATETQRQALERILGSAADANEKQSWFRGNLYGPSGVGKSVLAAMILRSLIKSTDGFIIDVDTSEGYVSWRNHPGLNKGIKVIPFTNFADLRTLIRAIRDKVTIPINGEVVDLSKCKGLILDEYSKMVEIDVLRIHEARQAGQLGAAGTQSGPDGSLIPGGWDYQYSLQRFRLVNAEVHDLRDLHIVTTAHQQDKKDKAGNILLVWASFPPRINQNMKEAIHLVAHITGTLENDPTNPGVVRMTRKAQVHPTTRVDAKTRIGFAETSVNADELPARIKRWLDEGGVQVDAEDTPREEVLSQEEFNEAVKDKSPQEILAMLEEGTDEVIVDAEIEIETGFNIFG